MSSLSQEARNSGRTGAIMELYEIGIILVLMMLSNVVFYSMGIKTGYLDGRKAVREYYEKRDKVRA
jgi:hypothetical protein